MGIILTQEEQEMLRRFIDHIWNIATESEAVPCSRWADDMINTWIQKEHDRI